MKRQFYFIENNKRIQFIIANKGFHWFPAIILGVFSIFCFSFPIMVILFTTGSIGFGFIITILIFGGIGIYSLRIFLWNLFGKEVFQLSNNQITHYYNYGLFRDNFEKLNGKKLIFCYSIEDDPYEIFEFEEGEIFDANRVYFPAFKLNKQSNISDFAVSIDGIINFRQLGMKFNRENSNR